MIGPRAPLITNYKLETAVYVLRIVIAQTDIFFSFLLVSFPGRERVEITQSKGYSTRFIAIINCATLFRANCEMS